MVKYAYTIAALAALATAAPTYLAAGSNAEVSGSISRRTFGGLGAGAGRRCGRDPSGHGRSRGLFAAPERGPTGCPVLAGRSGRLPGRPGVHVCDSRPDQDLTA